jgi:hypothetical protein
MVKIEKLKQRPDGSEVKIVGEAMYGAGLHLSIDTYVLVRESANHQWRVASDRPHPDWRTMSVDEYAKRGRAEKFQVASHGEILSVANEVRLLAEGSASSEDAPERAERPRG